MRRGIRTLTSQISKLLELSIFGVKQEREPSCLSSGLRWMMVGRQEEVSVKRRGTSGSGEDGLRDFWQVAPTANPELSR